jgi:hypothetical protein
MMAAAVLLTYPRGDLWEEVIEIITDAAMGMSFDEGSVGGRVVVSVE